MPEDITPVVNAAEVKEHKRAYTGVGRVMYSVHQNDGSDGPVKLFSSLVEFSKKHNFNANKAHAGDKAYLQNSTYGGTDWSMTIYNLTKEAYCDTLGHKLSTEGGIIRNSTDFVPYITLMYEQNFTEENGAGTEYGTLFKGKIAEPEIKGKTVEDKGVEYQTMEVAGNFESKDNGDYDYTVDKKPTKWGTGVPSPTLK